ncbi:SIR2 family NAD-dependent protein deacylase [Geodermatophilus sp. SYSU D00703]
MAAHVFVVPGTLQSLAYDDVLLSTDFGGGVGSHFWPVFGWSEEAGAEKQQSLPWLSEERRVALVEPLPDDPDGPRRWLVAVGGTSATPVPWLLDGVRQALTAVAEADPTGLTEKRPRRVAMPVMGVGSGGFDGRRGEVIHGLLDVAQWAADDLGLDVVIVAAKPSDYSALQALRAARHSRPLVDRFEVHAQRLAALARSGQLALFMGAGTGIAAGLPSWDDLLEAVAERVGLKGGGALSEELGPLDAAELVRRYAERNEREENPESPRPNPLGRYVAEAIGQPSRYALSHALLAALDVDQAITTNFDRLYETAVGAIRRTAPFIVLPETATADLAVPDGRRPWLLKLHGDIDRPEDIVLDRRSFVRYDARRRPLGGVLQTTLLTKHLLVVGASMTDDNVIRLIHEVAELNERPGEERAFGTVLSLRPDPMRAQLWEPELRYVDLGNEGGDLAAAGRELEIFLDRVAMLAAPRTAHLLDPRYRELLETEEERRVAASLSVLADDVANLPKEVMERAGWDDVVRALDELGAYGG